MKNYLFRVAVLFLFSTLSLIAPAQTETTPQTAAATAKKAPVPKLSNGPLVRQYQDILQKSNNYQEYKVVRQSLLHSFWSSIEDSLQRSRRDMQLAQKKIADLQSQINNLGANQKAQMSNLKQSIQSKEQEIQEREYNSARVSVLGIGVVKDTYVILTYIIFTALVVVAAVAFMGYQSSNKVATAARKDYDEVKEELEGYRQRMLEKQTQLGRELQTERNRIEELTQQIASLQKQLRPNRGTSTFSSSQGI